MAETTQSNLLSRWAALIVSQGWPDAVSAAAGRDLVFHCYRDPRRAYHNQRHLLECLEEIDAAQDLSEDAVGVELALWFHDAIYDATRSDNEGASADLAVSFLKRVGARSEQIDRVRELILDTAHRREPATPDGRLIVDIDLSILGKPNERFDAYDAAIRVEYAHVPEEVYRAGRAAVLRGFLDRPSVYRLPYFVAKYEGQARANIALAISRLQDV